MILVLAKALLHLLWQGAVLAGLYAAARPVLRRLDPSWRHATQLAALFVVPVMFIVTLFDIATTSPRSLPSSVIATAPVAAPPPTWALGVTLIWLAGSTVLLGSTLVALRRLRSLRASGLPLRELIPQLTTLAERLGLRRRVGLGESPWVATPMVVGVLRPMILLPIGLVTGLEPAHLQAVLAHELAHVRRHDLLLGALQRAVEIVFFFHPVVWWISAEARTSREQACDDVAVLATGCALTYARALTEVAALPPPPALAHLAHSAAGAHQGVLMSRIRRIIEKPAHSPRPPLAAIPVAVLGLAASLALGCMATEVEETLDAGAEALAATSAPRHAIPESVAAVAGQDSLSIAWLPESVRAFEAQIVAAATRHGVDPNLVAIVVLVESRGRSDAQSPIGARGLMQVMPATAAQVATRRGLPEPSAEDLDDPAYNLDVGTWFLAEQLASFGQGRPADEAVRRAAAAYNGGPGRLRDVLAGEAELSEETQQYRDLVAALWTERALETSPTLAK